jgi:chromosome segregation ATPase/predicted transcriptional regulator
MSLYLKGYNEKEIAKKEDVSQSTVSTVISRSKRSPLVISNDDPLSRQIDELRSLSVDLRNAGISVEEARSACSMIGELKKLGISWGILPNVIQVYRRISPDDYPKEAFVKATIEMIRLMEQYKLSLDEILSEYKNDNERVAKLKKQIEDGKREIEQVAERKKKAEEDLERELDENRITLEQVGKALEARQIFEKAGLDIERTAAAGNVLKIFCNLAESEGQNLEKAAGDLLKFLGNAQSLDQSLNEIASEIETSRKHRDALAAEVNALKAEKNKLTLENSFLKEAIESVLQLREKYGIGVNEIVRMRTLAEKYGTPSAMLAALDTYKSLLDLQEREAKLQASVEELTRTEASVTQKIKTVEERLASIPASANQSIAGINSSVKKFSDQVQGLGEAVGKASEDVAKMKDRAIAAGKELAAIESRVEAYKLTSKLVDFMASGQGKDVELMPLAIQFLDRLSKWTQDQPKYSTSREQIKSLKDRIERDLVLG